MSAGGLRPLLAGVPRREGESVVVAGSRREIRVDGDADLAEAVLGRCDGHRTRNEILAGLPEADRADAEALLGELVAAGRLDELCLTLAPVVGGDPLPIVTTVAGMALRRFSLCHAATDDGSLFLRYEAARDEH